MFGEICLCRKPCSLLPKTLQPSPKNPTRFSPKTYSLSAITLQMSFCTSAGLVFRGHRVCPDASFSIRRHGRRCCGAGTGCRAKARSPVSRITSVCCPTGVTSCPPSSAGPSTPSEHEDIITVLHIATAARIILYVFKYLYVFICGLLFYS